MMTSTPTHYDTLGVSETASIRTIERAWRRLVAKEGPGSPRLPELNGAAEVLLDPARRKEYDAELAAARPAPEPSATDSEPASSKLRWIPLVVLPVLAVLAVVLATVLTLQARERDAAERAGVEAQAVAATSLESVLSYDYRRLEADRDRAVALMAPKLRKEFEKTYDELLATDKNGKPGAAVQTKTVVTAKTVGTAVMDAEPDEVTVLAFVNQSSVHGNKAAKNFANRVRVVLVQQDDRWLIEELDPR